MLHIFFLVFQRDNLLLSLLIFSAHFCSASIFFFFNKRILKTRRRKRRRRFPLTFLLSSPFSILTLTFLYSSPKPPLFFPFFLLGFHWLSGLAHLLWVGGTYPLLIGDSLAD